MKRAYEIVVILRLDVDESVVNSTIDQIRGWIEGEDNATGTVQKLDRWGRRKLAYEIKDQREGYYVMYNAEMESRNLGELERNLNLNQTLLRYLAIRKDD